MDQQKKSLVEDLVTVLRWHEKHADVECPGGHQDAIVYIDGPVPFLHCLHERCQSEVAEINKEFWAQADDLPECEKLEPTPAEIAQRKYKKHLREVTQTAHRRVLPSLPSVDPESWSASSLVNLNNVPVEEQWRLFLTHLYAPDDRIWCGELYQSGPLHKDKFKLVSEWTKGGECPGPQVSVYNFKANVLNTGERKRVHVSLRRFLVLEDDHDPFHPDQPYPKDRFGAVITWMQKVSTLRAIVDTGNKSWHCFFDAPEFKILHFWSGSLCPIFEGREIDADEASDRDLYRNPDYLKAMRERDRREAKLLADYHESLRVAGHKEGELRAILNGFGP